MKDIIIIGGGLAGAACAYYLTQAGATCTIYEANGIASGASGNIAGLYNPRLSAEWSPQAQYFSAGFYSAQKIFAALSDIDWKPCGALHLATDSERLQRYEKMLHNWPWTEQNMRWLEPAEVSRKAGIEMFSPALYLPCSGSVSPKKLCAALISEATNIVHNECQQIPSGATVILACGIAVQQWIPLLPLRAVRGQITITSSTRALDAALCYGGYTVPLGGMHIMVGSTFARGVSTSEIKSQDDLDNISKLRDVCPSLAESLVIRGQRAGVRTTTPDHFPVVGKVEKNLFVSTGHGSHGIVSSIIAAKILCAQIMQQELPVDPLVLRCLSPQRFA